MNNPKKPARWQLDVWTIVMLLLAVLLLRVSIPDAWQTFVQIGWCFLTMGGMGVWVWINRGALHKEDEAQRRKQQYGFPPPNDELTTRTLPLTQVQRNFLRVMGQSTAAEPRALHKQLRTGHASLKQSPKSIRRQWLPCRRLHTGCVARTEAAPEENTTSHFVLTVIWLISLAFTGVGALVFLVLMGHVIAPYWSRLALILYAVGGTLAISIYCARPSWRLLVYPLVLAVLIYLWDDTLPPPNLPAGYTRMILPLIVFGWIALDGSVRLRRVIHKVSSS